MSSSQNKLNTSVYHCVGCADRSLSYSPSSQFVQQFFSINRLDISAFFVDIAKI